jgi:hypothetical protein
VGAKPQAALVAAKLARPARKTRRRPSWSAVRPAVISRAAKTMA